MNTDLRKMVNVLTMIALLVAGLAACSPAATPAPVEAPPPQPAEAATQPPAQAVETKGEIIAGVEATFPPWAWVEEGEFKGIAVDAIRAIAESEGVNIKFQDMPWPSLIPALVEGKIDLVVTAVSVTEERAQVLDYTIPWWEINRVVLVKKDSSLDGVTALCCGVTVAGQGGSTDFEWVKQELATNPGLDIELREFEDPVMAVEDLKVGRVDSVVIDSDTGAKLAAEHADIRVAAQFYTNPPEPYAFPVSKGDPKKLLPLLNRGMMELYSSGKWAEIVHEYIPGVTILPVPAFMPDFVQSYQKPIPGME